MSKSDWDADETSESLDCRTVAACKDSSVRRWALCSASRVPFKELCSDDADNFFGRPDDFSGPSPDPIRRRRSRAGSKGSMWSAKVLGRPMRKRAGFLLGSS
jgi:hypothetical protein